MEIERSAKHRFERTMKKKVTERGMDVEARVGGKPIRTNPIPPLPPLPTCSLRQIISLNYATHARNRDKTFRYGIHYVVKRLILI